MKKWIVTCALLTIGSMAFAQVNTLTKKEKKEHFLLNKPVHMAKTHN